MVFTNWVQASDVTSGPQPGYRPALTGLTGQDIQKASAATDGTGINWGVDVKFTTRGADLFRKLTHDNVVACPGPAQDCPRRHMGIWLDLSQADIEKWSDPGFTAQVSQPYDLRCLAHVTATIVCPKFVSDPTSREEISGGEVMIFGAAVTKQSVDEFVNAINPASKP